jgi:hypothetical protein
LFGFRGVAWISLCHPDFLPLATIKTLVIALAKWIGISRVLARAICDEETGEVFVTIDTPD